MGNNDQAAQLRRRAAWQKRERNRLMKRARELLETAAGAGDPQLNWANRYVRWARYHNHNALRFRRAAFLALCGEEVRL